MSRGPSLPTSPIDAWTRRRLRESKGLIIRKLRGVEQWDVIDERSGRVLHSALDASGMVGFLSGTSVHDDLLTATPEREQFLVVSAARRVALTRRQLEHAEEFLAEITEQFGWDADTVAAVLEREELGQMMEGLK